MLGVCQSNIGTNWKFPMAKTATIRATKKVVLDYNPSIKYLESQYIKSINSG